MVTPTITFRGVQALESSLIDLAKEFGYRNARNAINPALKKAMKVVEADILANTPVDSGNIKASIKTKVGTGPAKKSKAINSENIVAGVSTGWTYPNFTALINLEYGNRRQPPANVIRGSLEKNEDKVITNLSAGWEEAIKKATTRLNKRKKLGKLTIK